MGISELPFGSEFLVARMKGGLWIFSYSLTRRRKAHFLGEVEPF